MAVNTSSPVTFVANRDMLIRPATDLWDDRARVVDGQVAAWSRSSLFL